MAYIPFLNNAYFSAKVGIGTDSPDGILEVQTTNDNRYIRFKAPNGEERFQFYTGGTGNAAALNMYTSDGTTRNVQISAGGTSYFNAGNVGIGTTSPSFGTGGGLQITNATQANLRFTDTSASTFITDLALSNDDFYIINRAASGQLKFRVNASTEAMTIASNGNVGIGITSPSQKLHVNAGTTNTVALFESTDATSRIVLKDNSGEGQVAAIGDNITFATSSSGSERMRITDTGNVGIGTSNPGAKLHVLNTNVGVKSLYATAIIENTDSQLDLTSSSAGTWGSSLNLIEGNGATNTNIWSIARTTSGGGNNLRFNFGTNNQHDNDTKMVINSSGNVGIGTTSPTAPLHFGKTVYGAPSSEDFFRVKFFDNGGIMNDVGIGQPTAGAIGWNILPNSTGYYEWNSGTLGRIMNLDYLGKLTLDSYDSTNNTGTPTYLLGTDASGNVVKTNTVPGSGAGPYLPLAGGTMTGSIKNGDGVYSYWGTGDDLQIGHDGTNSYIIDKGAGDLLLYYSDDFVVSKYGTSEVSIRANQDSSVELFFDNSKKFQTTSAGVTIDGAITITDTTGTRGINRNNTGYNLDLMGGTNNTDGAYISLSGETRGGAANPYNGRIEFYSGGSGLATRADALGDIIFGTKWSGGFAQFLVLDSSSGDATFSNNVGIGTTSPRSILEAKGNISIYDPTTALAIDDTLNGLHFYTNDFSYNPPSGRLNTPVSKILPVNENTAGDSFGLSFYTAGVDLASSEKVRISSTGNVGIGTTSPDRKLEVDFTASAYGAKFTRSDATGSSLVEFANSAGVKSIIGYDAGVDGYKIGTASATNLVVKQNGNVGIGTTSPSQRAVVSGPDTAPSFNTTAPSSATLLLSNSDTGYGTYFGSTSSGTGLIQQRRQTSAVYYDLALNPYGGNVGIGTTSPGYKLSVSGNIGLTDGVSTGLLALVGGNYYIQNTGAYSTVFQTNGAERMRITSAGHLLVNKTSSTGDIFQVQGNNNVFASRLDGSTTVGQSYGLRVRAGTNSADTSMLIENTSGTDLFVVKGTGNTGIGVTTPRAKLDVAGGIKVADDTDTAGANKVGTLRYRTSGNNSYVDMCMQTGASTYAWINVVQNNW